MPRQPNTDLIPLEEKVKKEQDIEQISSEIQELREKYRQETGKRPIYDQKETKGFREWLEKQKKLTRKKQEIVKKSESREEWEILLEKWVNEANENEISKEIKDELINIIRKYREFRHIYCKIIQVLRTKNLQKREIDEIENLLKKLEKMSYVQAEIFKNLRAFQEFYNINITWFEHKIVAEKIKFIKHLAQKLNKLKNKKEEVKDLENFSIQEIKDYIKNIDWDNITKD